MKTPYTHRFRSSLLAALAVAAVFAGCAREEKGTYATPEEAITAFSSVVGTGDVARAEEIFGPGSVELFRTGDEAEDKKAADRVKALVAEKVAFEELDENTRVALFGERAWPFPIPLVKVGERWKFDTAAGAEELLNRRVGYYELATLDSLHAYVDAQREYAAAGRDGNPPAFAQRFFSTEGKQDGLFWESAEGEPESPLGHLLAEAAATHEPREPYRGYHYRILTGQGKNAPGGERSYLNAEGLMTGGFAAVAWPAKYGNSGVMTFLVNHRGIVFEKDLGAETEAAVAAIQTFDPEGWEPTADALAQVEGVDEELAAEEAPAEETEGPTE
jgi:hypothetical protein